jgi:manganese efflux pump family protein
VGFAEMLLIAVGLAMDAFAVSLGIGATQYAHGLRPAFRLAFHFGLFQMLMPVLGWLAGSTVVERISSVDHWIAFGLLAFVGGRMIHEGLKRGESRHVQDPSRGLTLLVLCVATSIDALAVGLSLAMLKVKIFYPVLVIGVVTAFLSVVGLKAGKRLGAMLGKRMEVFGGVLLFAIGVRILVEHLR